MSCNDSIMFDKPQAMEEAPFWPSTALKKKVSPKREKTLPSRFVTFGVLAKVSG
jgi:hypothetical protein